MKKTFLLLFSLGITTASIAQNKTDKENKPSVENKNMVKLNLLALSARNISVQYERLITPKTTVSVTFNNTPSKGLPFSNSLESFVDDKTTVHN